MKKTAALLFLALAACRTAEPAAVPQETAAVANPHMERVIRFHEEARPLAERMQQDPAFAGFVFKNEPEPYAILLFTGDAEARLRRYTSDPRFRARQATLTDDELRALQESFGERLSRLGIHWGASWGEDEHNRVVFQVPEIEKVERAVAEGRLDIPPNVRIERQAGTIAQTPQTAGPVTYFPQFRYPAAVSMQALASGVLELRNGCLFIGDRLVLWPSGARLAVDAQGVPVVNGELRAGERIEIGGGTAPQGFDESALIEPIPARCRAPMWIAAG